ncbi:DUF2784 domain-containing protein [Nocardiopsis composta]|uniref:DUF2784 domain-containing protein n=1 Tax=Nocardiopsis composta TaxID=157465 RepID=A0A7W8QSM9_9ACTN|nr:DUF2784 domain-containing protein [Nocardiopsis composta]MBB5435857.1 hypothetical protein [Nocardiopsis composta]
MGYRLLAEAAMLVHFAFLGYVVAGGFLAWRWPAAVWPHAAAACYGLGIIAIGWECPLTHVEQWARLRAGRQGLPEGFVDHYLTGVVYPEAYLEETRIAAAAVVLSSWAGAALLARRRRRRRPAEGGRGAPASEGVKDA